MFDEVGIYDDHLIEAVKQIKQITFFQLHQRKKYINKRQTVLGEQSALEEQVVGVVLIFDIWNIDMSTLMEMGRNASVCKNEEY